MKKAYIIPATAAILLQTESMIAASGMDIDPTQQASQWSRKKRSGSWNSELWADSRDEQESGR